MLYHETAGRLGKPVRLMVGLTYLKHTYNLSDEQVCERWVENPYWQFLCGFDYLQHLLPIDPSSLTRWRERQWRNGHEIVARSHGRGGGGVGRGEAGQPRTGDGGYHRATEGDRASPGPAALDRGREILVRLAARHGIKLRQSYQRLAKRALRLASRYAHTQQVHQARRRSNTSSASPHYTHNISHKPPFTPPHTTPVR